MTAYHVHLQRLRRFIVCTVVVIFFTLNAFAQNQRVDSLLNALDQETESLKQITILNELCGAFRYKDFDKAIEFAERGREIASSTNNESLLARILICAANGYYFQGNHEKGLTYYLQSLKIYERLKDDKGKIDVLNEIGTLEKKQGDLAKSEEHLTEALRLSESIRDSARIANSMNNLGHVYELHGNFGKAMQLYRESVVIKEKLRDWYGASFNYDNIANILTQQGKYTQAQQYYEKEIKVFRKLNDRGAYAIAINNLGEMNKTKGDYRKARELFLQALDISTAIKYKDLKGHIYTMLAETYAQEGDFRNAYGYFQKSAALKDSVFNEQKSKQLIDLQTKYETEKKENEIQILKQENEIKDFGLRQTRLFILGLVIVLLALVIVGLLWISRVRLKQNIQLEATRASLREAQLQAVITSQEGERKRFAADLHDGLGQIISAVRMSLSHEKPGKETVDHALGLLTDINAEIRNIAFNLMPQALMTEELDVALRQLAARINRAGDVQITITAHELTKQISIEKKIALYRICQEWINNVIKYSSCSNISIQLVQHPDELIVTIEDDGQGFDPASLTGSEGNGWKNINSRVTLIKGNIEIDSRPGRRGSTMILSVPAYAMAV